MQLHRSCEITKSVVVQNRFPSLAKFKLQRMIDSNRSTLQGLLVWSPEHEQSCQARLLTLPPASLEQQSVNCYTFWIMTQDCQFSTVFSPRFHPPFNWSQEKLCFFTPTLAPPDSPQFHWQPWGVIFRPRAFATLLCHATLDFCVNFFLFKKNLPKKNLPKKNLPKKIFQCYFCNSKKIFKKKPSFFPAPISFCRNIWRL